MHAKRQSTDMTGAQVRLSLTWRRLLPALTTPTPLLSQVPAYQPHHRRYQASHLAAEAAADALLRPSTTSSISSPFASSTSMASASCTSASLG